MNPTRIGLLLLVLSWCLVAAVLAARSGPKPLSAIDAATSAELFGTPVMKAYAYLNEFEESSEFADDQEKVSEAVLRKFARAKVPSTLFEPTEEAYWGNWDTPREPVRLTNTTLAEFSSHIRRGRPVIVTDAARGWPMEGWSCEMFQKKFKNAEMIQSYAKEGKGKRNKGQVKLGAESWLHSQINTHAEDTGNGPQFAPFYWGVKDQQGGRNSHKARIQALTRTPYFLTDVVNGGSLNNTAEVWFSPASKAGAKVHADPHCDGIMSVQLVGSKRWRLSPPPSLTSIATAKRGRDGDTDTTVWRPFYDVVLKAGEGLFFPPGFLHETSNVGDCCSSSLTYQWLNPVLTDYIRDFLPRLALGEATRGCEAQWGQFVQLSTSPRVVLAASTAAKRARKLFRAIGGAGTLGDFERYVAKKWGPRQLQEYTNAKRRKVSRKKAKQITREFALESFRWHDVNGNGHVTEAEFVENAVAWNTINALIRKSQLVLRSYRKFKRKTRCARKEFAQQLGVGLADGLGPTRKVRAAIAKLSPNCQRIARAAQDVVEETRVHLLRTRQKATQKDEL